MKLTATKTRRYAQSQPHLPQISVIKDTEYEVGPGKDQIPLAVANRIVELDGGKLVKPRSTGGDLEKAVTAAKKKVTGFTNKITSLKETLGNLSGDPKTKAEANLADLEGKLQAAEKELQAAEDAANKDS
jgi:uncharacterized protein YjbJ (UPF0337 family)